jgi:membrane fusion protein (multidrug efflux system)
MFVPPPEAVTTAVAKKYTWANTFLSVGSVESINGALLSSQEAGTVTKILYEPGSRVKEGTPLIEIDSNVQSAQLKGALSYSQKMKKTFERAKALKEKNAISNDEFDSTKAEYDKALADVESLKADVARRRLIAPVSGIVGIRSVSVGDYVQAGTHLVSVHELGKLFVNFSAPQSLIGKIVKGAKVEVISDNLDGKSIIGTVTAVDPDVAADTRNFKIQATVDNPEELLRPGMFVTVKVETGTVTDGIVIPVSSINSAPYGDSIFVVESKDDKKIVAQRFVKIGGKKGDFAQVISGVNDGEEVVTSGLFKLSQGTAVLVNNENATKAELNPKPEDS